MPFRPFRPLNKNKKTFIYIMMGFVKDYGNVDQNPLFINLTLHLNQILPLKCRDL